MIAASDYPEDTVIVSADGNHVFLLDTDVMRYCSRVLKAAYEVLREPTP
jgi:hypothetical protein